MLYSLQMRDNDNHNQELSTALEANSEAMTREPFHTDAQAEFGTAEERLAERNQRVGR